MTSNLYNSYEPPIKKIKTEIKTEKFDGDKTNCKPPGLGKSPNISKRQLKKLIKKRKWLINLPNKRAEEKLKLKRKKQEAREQNLKLGPTRKELRKCTMAHSKCTVKVALDFSFDDLMSPRDLAKCINQLMRCYSFNRRSPNPLQFFVVNFNGPAKEEIKKNKGYENWDVYICNSTYMDLFKKESLVYLTSDSDNVIETIDADKVYIIGALVDHNAQKGLCHRIATEQGISHGRLPIREYLEMKGRKVLAINHVFEILVNVCNGMSWKDALLNVLPQRKGAVVKIPHKNNSKNNEENINPVIANLKVEQSVENNEEEIKPSANLVLKPEPTSDFAQNIERIPRNEEEIKPSANLVVKPEQTSDFVQIVESIPRNEEEINPIANLVKKEEPIRDYEESSDNILENNEREIKPPVNLVVKQEPASNCQHSVDTVPTNEKETKPIPDLVIKQEPTNDCEN